MESKKKNFLPKPEYPGGLKAMSNFISKNLVYPLSAIENKIQGFVSLRLEINYLGVVVQVKVVHGLNEDCDKEAIRLALLLLFKVGKIHQMKVSYSKNIQIHFNLPKPNESIAIQYTLTKNESQTINEVQPNSYFYKVIQ
ncbi:MAG: energy transducer TonB [Saprospiraceae bacterium]